MEEKINIAEILKDKPQGTKLYADAFGELSIEEICTEDELGIILLSSVGDRLLFYNDGRFNLQGEPILVPSKEMRNWNKFSWKKGDVLVTENGAAHIIFEKFTDDTYTIFAGKYYYCKNGAKGYTYLRFSDNAITEEFTLETEDAAKTYISFIEKRLGGKLNRETLEIEKAQPEFKPFDKVLVRNTDTEEWFPGFFEKFDSTWNYPYHIMNRRSMTDFAFKQCIPYEGNEHLLGTTKDVGG